MRNCVSHSDFLHVHQRRPDRVNMYRFFLLFILTTNNIKAWVWIEIPTFTSRQVRALCTSRSAGWSLQTTQDGVA